MRCLKSTPTVYVDKRDEDKKKEAEILKAAKKGKGKNKKGAKKGNRSAMRDS